MSARRTAAALLAGLVLVLLPAAALATKPGHWTPVTSADGVNIDQVALLRTPDHVLHVVWHRKTPGNPTSADLMQTLVTPAGKVGAAQTIASDWIGIGDAALVRGGDGRLSIFAGATHTLDPGTVDGTATWSSTDGGASWSAPTVASIHGGFSDDVGAAIGGDGATPFFGWGETEGLLVHRGTVAATGEANFQTAAGFGCCGYSPGFALDATNGQLVVAWYSNATGHTGVYAQLVDQATGGPVGSPALMPGTAQAGYSIAHTPVVARAGKPGVFVAYGGGSPSAKKVLVWRYGAKHAQTVARRSAGVGDVGVAAGPKGRLWAFWSSHGRIYARRSNAKLSRWGATVSVRPAKHTGVIYKLAGDAQAKRLDLFGAFAPDLLGSVQTWHTQLLPGLALTAQPHRLKVGGVQKLKLRVTDAGAGVAKAKVKLGHAKRTTNGKGVAVFKVGPFSRRAKLVATATKAGYVKARAVVRVR